MSTYTYSVIKSSWGIWIRLSAEAQPLLSGKHGALEVSSGVWIEVTAAGLDESERQYLVDGIRSVAGRIRKALGHEHAMVVRVLDVEYNLTDYQADALEYAMASWAATEFKFEAPCTGVSFDRAQNRYIFEPSS